MALLLQWEQKETRTNGILTHTQLRGHPPFLQTHLAIAALFRNVQMNNHAGSQHNLH